MPRLQRFTQHFQHLAIKFRQLIQEQHPMMSQGDFSRLWFRAAVGFLIYGDGPILEAFKLLDDVQK
jgi:hypothetical protein